jgi:hypothetical protein
VRTVGHRRVFRRAACCALVVVLAGCTVDPPVRDQDGVVRFSGSINDRSVSAFIARHGDARVTRVVVDSPGGDVMSGIRLANWIVDRHADVEVEARCASSCANYLFAAGRRKIIDDRAIVLWHGSILQKDFRARGDECERRIRALQRAGEDVDALRASDPEIAYCLAYRDAVEAQRAFFARVGVDEYVTRMGQEPHDFGSIWTIPVDVMERLGLTGVEARRGYGTHGDLKHWNQEGFDEPILALGFDDAGQVVELAR